MARSENARSLRQMGAFRLLVALFLLWLSTIAPGDSFYVSEALPSAQFTAVGYLVFALLLAVLSGADALTTPTRLHYQVIVGALGDILAIGLVLLTAGGVKSGLGLLLIPMLAGNATIVNGRSGLFLASVAALMLLVTENFIGPRSPWPFDPQPTQTGILGAILFVAVIVSWRLALRAGTSEARLVLQEQDLVKLAELNEKIIAGMDTGVIAVDRSGRIQNINAAAQRMLGWDTGKARRGLPPRLEKALAEWLRGPAVAATVQIPGDTGHRELEARLAPIGFAGQQGTLVILEETAEIKRRGHAGKLQALGRLTASIAHEIRNPLSAISHSAQLLAESPAIEGGDRRLLDIIQSQSQRMDGLIRGILTLSRDRPATQERIRLRERLAAFAEDLYRTRQVAPGALSIDVNNATLTVLFDPTQFNQVVWNLCNNALIHAGHAVVGSQPIVLKGHADPLRNLVMLDVIDAGPGIPQEQRDSLFEPFSSSAPGGTGLGLYISRLLCENNGASIEYLPQPSGGCFRVSFALTGDQDPIREPHKTDA
ncbi:MAG TPA: ATP-binding protein [Thioalkalivibrio sp.]|nr:ATP-binding protein [Thioalkalivibrio sp.]